MIDIGASDGSRQPILVEAGGNLGEYLALSYCWGASSQLVTTTASFRAHCDQFEFSQLSKNVQDAITITRKLGFQYLWVDALCIIQDSPTMDDWAIQSSRMDQIYGHAHTTIVAAISKDSSHGIFPQRAALDFVKVPFQLEDKSRCGSVQLVERLSTWNAVSGRQWAFQEKEFAFGHSSFDRKPSLLDANTGILKSLNDLVIQGNAGQFSTSIEKHPL